MTERRTVSIDGIDLSVVSNAPGPPQLLLLHGTFWSRVWEPVLRALGDSITAMALDFPGFGRSGGELTVDQATVPALARIALRAADALGAGNLRVAGHDIGGAVAQHLLVEEPDRVAQIVLVNSVLYDSWPVPAVARFRDPGVRERTAPQDFRDQRRSALERATARRLDDVEVADYLSPWEGERHIRSWMALAAAADPQYTLDVMPALRDRAPAALLIWGDADEFQPVTYAERFAADVPSAELVRIAGARHIPMEDDPERVAHELVAFLEALTISEEM